MSWGASEAFSKIDAILFLYGKNTATGDNGNKPAGPVPEETQPPQKNQLFPFGGVVITFADITAAKALETGLRDEKARLKRLLGSGD
ncbi:MAG: hypothetical protein NDI73_03005 [Desulfuromonadales bacterium]|nr:hypothetical protein [Desulfuromonadales bacterium]